jgi:hypothetical protein
MSDAPLTASVFKNFQRDLFLYLEGLETRLTARIDGVNSRVDDVYGHIDGLYHRFGELGRQRSEWRWTICGYASRACTRASKPSKDGWSASPYLRFPIWSSTSPSRRISSP